MKHRSGVGSKSVTVMCVEMWGRGCLKAIVLAKI